ncbi:MAG: hypothetical protein J6R89_02115 [Clostridia bacterium]|nr:hypothetical protein [Clostridia bacterium]
MKLSLRVGALFLSLLLLFSFASSDLSSLQDFIPNGGDESYTPPTYTEVTADAFTDCYGDQLSPNEQAVYDAILAAEAGENEFSVVFPETLSLCKNRAPTASEQNEAKDKMTYWISNALLAAWLDAPALFWLDFSDYSYSCTFAQGNDGVISVTDLVVKIGLRVEGQTAATRAAALSAALAAIKPYGASDAELVRSINSLLAKAVEYDLEADDRATAAGALVDGRCVCEGYAHAFQLLCQKAGIDCVCILGDATSNGKTEGHMWNAVRIDGVWYYCDPTWNDTTSSVKYLLVGGDTKGHEDTFDKTHIPENSLGKSKAFALPVVSKTAYEKK